MARRRKDGIECHSEAVLQHRRNHSFEHWAVDFQTRIVVDLDQPRFPVSVYHEIQSEYLEVVLVSFMVKDEVVGLDDADCHFLHPTQHVLF